MHKIKQQILDTEQPRREQIGNPICTVQGDPEHKSKQKKHNGKRCRAAGQDPVKPAIFFVNIRTDGMYRPFTELPRQLPQVIIAPVRQSCVLRPRRCSETGIHQLGDAFAASRRSADHGDAELIRKSGEINVDPFLFCLIQKVYACHDSGFCPCHHLKHKKQIAFQATGIANDHGTVVLNGGQVPACLRLFLG